MQCSHNPEPLSLVFAGCSVLSFLGLYWSPMLGVLVCPEQKRVIPGASLKSYLQELNVKDHPLVTLLNHLLSSFKAITIEDDLQSLYNFSLQYISVDRPIPGLQYDVTLTHYRCPECFKWYADLSDHLADYHSISLRSSNSGNHYFRKFSIMLDSSKPSFRIQLLINTPNDVPKVSGPHLDAFSLECHAADSDMVKRWMCPDFRNTTGTTAPTLTSGPVDGSYMFTVKGAHQYCLHLASGWDHSDMLYTGCAVLSFFQCFYSPVLRAIVNPRNKCLLHLHSLKAHIQTRGHKYKSIAEDLCDHVMEAFDLSKILTAKDLYENVHQNLVLPRSSILGLDSPKSQYWCPDCNMSYATSTSHFRNYHSGTLATIKGVDKVDVIVLWKKRELQRYTVRVTANAGPPPCPQKPAIIFFDQASHLEDYGINSLLKSWGEFDITTVLSLIAMPSDYVPSSDREKQRDSLAYKSEAFLKAFHKAVGCYLLAAQNLIQQGHRILRNALNGFNNEGYV